MYVDMSQLSAPLAPEYLLHRIASSLTPVVPDDSRVLSPNSTVKCCADLQPLQHPGIIHLLCLYLSPNSLEINWELCFYREESGYI